MGDLDQTIAAIDRIVVGRTDDDMREVVDVYGRQSGRYAVYQTDDRVVIVYAEDPLVQAIQRKRLAKLATRRGELNGLLMAWRGKSIRWSRLPQTARQFDMRIAAALIEALEGNSASGIEILDQVRADVRGEMAARARLSYLIWTLSSAAVFLAAALIAYAMLAGGTSAAVLGTQAVLRAVCAGVLGGVYSIALGIRQRDLKSDMRRYDYFTDSLVRIGIGAIAAFVLTCFLLSGALQLGFGTDIKLTGNEAAVGGIYLPSWPMGLIVGFLAGFAERLVPDLLNSYTVSARTDALPPQAREVAPTVLAVASGEEAQAAGDALPDDENEVITLPSAEEDVDGCDLDLADEATTTPDEALPAASGGVVQH